jgi:hypothetical protein
LQLYSSTVPKGAGETIIHALSLDPPINRVRSRGFDESSV